MIVIHYILFVFVVARASFAQERIFLDEQIRFVSKNINNVYVIPFLYRLSSMNNHVSINGLCRAFQSLITKHNILRTALFLDTKWHYYTILFRYKYHY